MIRPTHALLRLAGGVSVGILSLSLACQSQSSDLPDNPLPGAPEMNTDTHKELARAWAARDPDYRPRTRHLEPDGAPKYTNRLFLETSPYLLQHAHNPVNWYPWGDEAFETARRLGKPVLLSVGYSTCHWCHVMEEESFDDEEIAAAMNENYVAIKVDREERPDVDGIYMTAVQMMTGRGGWPMTVWMTPDRKPYYAGTYFPARDGDRGAGIGFLTMLHRLRAAYDQQPEQIAEHSDEVARAIEVNLSAAQAGGELPGAAVLRTAAGFYASRFDATHGGVQGAPKFPSSMPVRALLRYHRRTGDQRALNMASLTLEKMAGGGMYDHVGGGFHRYSTDAQWLVPHFEKMLYDNALLTVSYLEGYQVTGREEFARTAREILRYVERDMTSPEGAFYSATDADSPTPDGHSEEGWFFTWTPDEIDAALDPEQARIVKAYYAVKAGGNFEGRSILHTPRPAADVAAALGIETAALRSAVDAAREVLYEVRKQRPPPIRDQKILVSWNGLMISAHAHAALVLGEPRYAKRAAGAAAFILDTMREGGRLFRSSMNGRTKHNAYLDDYAFLIAGLLDLYEATGELRWIEEALALDRVVEEHYEDEENGGFFFTSDDHEKLLAREKPRYDGAEPSGNSVQALNLLRLHEFTTDDRYRRRAESTLSSVASVLERSPAALSEMLLAVDYHLDTPIEVVIVAADTRADADPFLARLRSTFLPNRILGVVAANGQVEKHGKVVPLVRGKIAQGGKTTAYVCERGVCKLPTTDPETFADQIARVTPLPEGGS